MKLKRLPLNLQFFAEEGIEIPDGLIPEDAVKDEEDEVLEDEKKEVPEVEEGDEADEAEGNEKVGDAEGEEGADEKGIKTVPLATHIEERNKLKEQIRQLKAENELVKKLSIASGKSPEQMLKEIEEIQIQNQVSRGVDPVIARQNFEQQKKLNEALREVRKEKRDIEIAKLKENPIFSDIEAYREEVEEVADMKEISLEQAYMLLRGPQIMAEMQYQNQYRNPSKKPMKKINTKQTPEVKIPSYETELSRDEIEIARMAGITPKEFYEMKKVEGLEGYLKTKKGVK